MSDPAVSVDGPTTLFLTSSTTTSAAPTSTTTSSASQPTINLIDTVSITTCEPAEFSWTLEDFTQDLEQTAANLYISTDGNLTSSSMYLGGVRVGEGQFVWDSVTLPAGNDYALELEILDIGLYAVSDAFTIVNGTNTSCVTGTVTPVVQSSSSASAILVMPTTSTTAVASSDLGTTTKSHTGTIIGATIVGTAVLILALLVAFSYRRRTKKRYSHRMPTRISPPIRPASPARSEITIVGDYDPSKVDKTDPSYGV